MHSVSLGIADDQTEKLEICQRLAIQDIYRQKQNGCQNNPFTL